MNAQERVPVGSSYSFKFKSKSLIIPVTHEAKRCQIFLIDRFDVCRIEWICRHFNRDKKVYFVIKKERELKLDGFDREFH